MQNASSASLHLARWHLNAKGVGCACAAEHRRSTKFLARDIFTRARGLPSHTSFQAQVPGILRQQSSLISKAKSGARLLVCTLNVHSIYVNCFALQRHTQHPNSDTVELSGWQFNKPWPFFRPLFGPILRPFFALLKRIGTTSVARMARKASQMSKTRS